jgi:hypothetical protein
MGGWGVGCEGEVVVGILAGPNDLVRHSLARHRSADYQGRVTRWCIHCGAMPTVPAGRSRTRRKVMAGGAWGAKVK